jgi:hypothetical protein
VSRGYVVIGDLSVQLRSVEVTLGGPHGTVKGELPPSSGTAAGDLAAPRPRGEPAPANGPGTAGSGGLLATAARPHEMVFGMSAAA